MSRWVWRSIAVVLAVIAIAFVAQKLFGDKTAIGTVQVPEPTATIGSGEEAVAVTASGAVIPWWPLPA
ncbi:MAG TPA: hypothetical protein VIH47_03295, partial [Solirubrobacterales bacterium]